MKKNKMLRLASVLLIVVILTTCVIGGTLAKYTTSDSAADTARVAQWGVTVTATADNIFDGEYASNTDGVAGNTVVTAVSTDELVAPGTGKTNLVNLSVAGKPEVTTKVTYTADLVLTGWTVDNAVYCPIEFTVGDETIKLDGTDITTLAELEKAVEDAIAACGDTYAANTEITKDDAPVVSWSWPINVDDDKDTALGNAETKSTISLTISVVAEQVD